MGNGDQPATRADLEKLRAELVEQLLEAIHDSETRLLKAFYGFTETVQTRFKDADRSEAGLKERMNILETRLLEVEKRINMPPQQ
jgi:hypothetical protein